MGFDEYHDPVFLRVPARMPWKDKGACRTADTKLFYPGVGTNGAEAKAICKSCPVMTECREWAIPNEKFGIWGGLSERERRNLRTDLAVVLECRHCSREYVGHLRPGGPFRFCSQKCRWAQRAENVRDSRIRNAS
jgi:WhiB family redox-sensing transcriptional regulator